LICKYDSVAVIDGENKLDHTIRRVPKSNQGNHRNKDKIDIPKTHTVKPLVSSNSS
jgi:hypothetical protein